MGTLIAIGWVIGVLGALFVGGCIITELRGNHHVDPPPKKVTWFNGSWKLP